MKINQTKMNHSKPPLLPDKNKAPPKLKSKLKTRKKVKNRKVNINQLVSSLGNTKISYLNLPSGTIECLETIVPNQTHNPQVIASNSGLSGKLEPKILKPRRRNVLKHKSGQNCQHSSSSPQNSIIKMTLDSKINNRNSILESFSDIKKTDKSGLSLLESFMLPENKEEEQEIKGANTNRNYMKSNFSVLQEIGLSKQSLIKTGTPSASSNAVGSVDKSANDSSNGPVCSIVLNSSNGTGNSVANFYKLESSKYLVFMKPASNLVVIGTVEVQLLQGSLEVFGYNMYKEDEKLLIYSLQGSSHLSLKATHDRPNTLQYNRKPTNNINVQEKLISLGLSHAVALKVSKKAENGVLFTITRQKTDVSSTVWPQFLEHHSSFNIFPSAKLFHNGSRPCHFVERKIQCLFEKNLQDLGLKEINEVLEWAEIERDVIDRDYPKAILCGGKSVGKSSFLRYLVNKCLFKWRKILVLDFDLGQCEFTIPGCISVTIVEEPLLGPNYSHLKKPKRSVFLGEVDVTKCPENYIEGCKSLMDYAKQKHSKIPWLINTMGFTKGFGISLACGIINYASPTHVVQIQSKDRKMNFPSTLEPKYVNCVKHSAFDVTDNTLDYKLYEIPSGSEQPGFISKSRGISPAESRNLVILSYFSRMLNSTTISLSQVKPYMIGIDQIDLQTTNKFNLTKAQKAAAMNGNMVALCHKKSSNEFLNCCGFGIVRGVDWQNETIYLITPLPPAELSKVICLVKGNVGLPDSLYYNQGDHVTGHVPFLALTSGGSTARFAKRDFRTLPVSQ